MTRGTRINGVTLTTPETTKARRREAPFLFRALSAKTLAEAQTELNRGRGAIERSREVSLESGLRKK